MAKREPHAGPTWTKYKSWLKRYRKRARSWKPSAPPYCNWCRLNIKFMKPLAADRGGKFEIRRKTSGPESGGAVQSISYAGRWPYFKRSRIERRLLAIIPRFPWERVCIGGAEPPGRERASRGRSLSCSVQCRRHLELKMASVQCPRLSYFRYECRSRATSFEIYEY